MLAAYDLADQIVLPALALALLLSPLWHDRGLQEALIAAAGALLVGASLRSMSAGGLGWGDVKMMAFVGAVVGAPAVVLAGLVTALSGGVGALLMIVTGRVTRHTRIPYAPFITVGGVVALLTV